MLKKISKIIRVISIQCRYGLSKCQTEVLPMLRQFLPLTNWQQLLCPIELNFPMIWWCMIIFSSLVGNYCIVHAVIYVIWLLLARLIVYVATLVRLEWRYSMGLLRVGKQLHQLLFHHRLPSILSIILIIIFLAEWNQLCIALRTWINLTNYDRMCVAHDGLCVVSGEACVLRYHFCLSLLDVAPLYLSTLCNCEPVTWLIVNFIQHR